MEDPAEVPKADPERIPFLELGDQVPPAPPAESPSAPVTSISDLPSDPVPAPARRPWLDFSQLRTAPRRYLLVLAFSILIIVLLLPRLAIGLSAVMVELLLVLRLLLPVLIALLITFMLWRWYQSSPPRR